MPMYVRGGYAQEMEIMNSRPLIGAVLAAGKGTRLRPLTHHLPKPLVPVAGRSLLEYAFDHLRRLKIEKIGINAHHLGSRLTDAFRHLDEEIYVVHEEILQGTGGGIREIAARNPEATLVVINGDALFDFDLAPVLAKHRSRSALGTLVLRYVPPGAPFGRVAIDGGGLLHRIAEMSARGADSLTLFYGAYTGVQIIEPELIAKIPDGPCDILRSAYKEVLRELGPIYGDFVAPESLWLDVGTPERYLAAHQAFLDGRLESPHLPEADAQKRRVSPHAKIHSSSKIIGPCAILDHAVIEADAVIGPHAFVGSGATVASGSRLSDTVVWDGVRASGELTNQIVLPDYSPS